MKKSILILCTVFAIFMLTPTASSVAQERSSSLGTGLPTDNDRYEREDLTPTPTKKPSTDYDFVDEDEEDSVDEEVVGDTATSTDESTEKPSTNTANTTNSQDEPATDEQHKTTEEAEKDRTTNSSAYAADSTAKAQTTNESTNLKELPQTGVQTNYFTLIGIIFIVLAIALLLFFALKKRREQEAVRKRTRR